MVPGDERTLSGRDFTLEKYAALCQAITSSGYTSLTIRDYLSRPDPPPQVVLVRHDVDDNIRFVPPLARIDHQHGIHATYYFRCTPHVYVPEVIDSVAALNHEIGYHYEALDRARGDISEAIRIFGAELARFRERYDVKTACMHGNPLSPHDNRKIWDHASLAQFGLLGEPYLSLDYSRIAYFSDTGRNWSGLYKVKDVVQSVRGEDGIETTDDLITAIRSRRYDQMCILVHPARWTGTLTDYLSRYLLDLVHDAGKRWILRR
jgi:hypothetical protein